MKNVKGIRFLDTDVHTLIKRRSELINIIDSITLEFKRAYLDSLKSGSVYSEYDQDLLGSYSNVIDAYQLELNWVCTFLHKEGIKDD